MKLNSSLAKIILAAIFFQSHFALAVDNYLTQTNNAVNAELQPLVCQKVPSPYWNSEYGGTAPMVDEPSCAAENVNRARVRANAANVNATNNRLTSGDGTTINAPKAPAYTCGGMDNFSSEFQACQNNYSAANSIYQKDLAAYNEAQKNIQAGQITAENAALAEQSSKSAAATLAEIKQKNEEGKKSYNTTSSITQALGVAAMLSGTACSVSCPTGCCAAAPKFFAVSAAMMLLSSLAKKQSNQHAAAAQNACTSLNQLSSTPTSCDGTTTGGPGGPTVTDGAITIDPLTGVCTPADSDACKQAPKVGVATGSVKDALGSSAFAAVDKKDLFKLQPDGSIKFKNGKTYKDSDFKDLNSLMATGMSAGMAKSVLDSMGSNASSLAKLAGKDLKKETKPGGQTYGEDGGTTVVNSSKPETSDKTYGDQLGKKDETFSEDRKPSSEGLAKEFNGELIGVAGDDIFLMMNRRYKLKSEQDSFIAQDLK
jgi:hypothetical protein